MDGVRGHGDHKRAGANADAVFGEEFSQAFHGAAHALLRRIVGSAEGDADFAEGFILEVAQQYGGAIGFIERYHGFVEQGFDMRPVGSGGVHGVQVGGDLLAQLPTGFAADDINGGAASDLIEPRGQHGRRVWSGRHFRGVAGEVGEDRLGDFLGELRGADLAERGGMDEIDMAANQFRKGGFGMVAGIAREQLMVAVGHRIAHFQKYIVAGWGNPTRNLYFNSIDGGGALSKFRFMLKSHIGSSRGAVAFPRHSLSRFWPTLLLLVGLLGGFWLSADATENDDRYFRIYGLIEQGDAFNKGGQVEKAKAKYGEAEKALKELKQLYPTYNAKLVTARLTYLAEKIKVLSQPPVTAVEPNEAPAASGTIKAGVPGQPQVKLLEAGAEPRQVFRLQAQATDVQKVKLTVRMKMGVVAPEIPSEMMTLPPMTLAATLTTKEVTPEGDALVEIVIDEAGVLKEAAAPAEAVKEMEQQVAGLKGLKMTGTVTDRYFTKKIAAEIAPGTSPDKRESLEQMKEAFANTEFILPEEAIGVGAKWELKKKAKEQGINIDEVIRHEIISIEDGKLVVKSSTTQSAANQKISNPIMPALKVDMTKMTGTATETATFDLTKTLPIKAVVDERSEINMSLNSGGKKQAMTMKTESHSTMDSE